MLRRFILSTALAALIGLVSIGAQQTYTVTQASGQVEVQLRAGAPWTPVSVGDSIPRSASLSTGFGARAVIEAGGIRLSLEPLTRVTVDELTSDASGAPQASVGLRTGRIRAAVRRSDSGRTRFRVSSPVATAAVRGTQFNFNGFRVDVDEGTVELIPPNAEPGGTDSVNIPRGAFSEMTEEGTPQDILDIIEDEILAESEFLEDDILGDDFDLDFELDSDLDSDIDGPPEDDSTSLEIVIN